MTPAIAQDTSANITGRITDPSGAAVANAKVTATDADRGTVFRTQTNTDGIYNLSRLPIGRYELRVEANGFQAAVHPAFALSLGQTASVDVALTIGQLSQQVVVTAGDEVLQTQTTEVGSLLEASSIANLPLETRNYNQLTLLIPGSVTISPASFNTGLKTFNSARPNINGNREQANYYLLDGMDNNEFVDNNVAYSPNVDAIQELNIITNNPSAELGQFLGGVISVSLKSGTNQFHGDAFEYLRNDFFNANEWSNNFNGLPTPAPALERIRRHVRRPHQEEQAVLLRRLPGLALRLARHARRRKPPSPRKTPPAIFPTWAITLHYPGTNVVDAVQSDAGRDLRSGTEDGREPLHHWHQPHRAEDRSRASEAQSSRHSPTAPATI